MSSSLKVKVSPKQMKFWEDNYKGDRVTLLKRMVKEFNLGLTAVNDIYNNFPDSFFIASSGERPFIPSHVSDNRVPVFLQKDTLDRLDHLMQSHIGGDPYTRFDDITPEIREDVFQDIFSEFEDTENEDQLTLARLQYPFGVYPIHTSNMETVLEVKKVLEQRLDSAAKSISEITAEFLYSTSHWDDEQKVISYIAVAEILYAHAEEKLQEMKNRPDNDS